MCALFSPMLVYICNFFFVHISVFLWPHFCCVRLIIPVNLLLQISFLSFFSLYFIVRSSTHPTNEKPRASGEMPCWHTDGCNAKKSHQYIQPSRVMIKNINDKSMTGPYGLFSLIHIFSPNFFTFIRHQTVKDSSFFANIKMEITIW